MSAADLGAEVKADRENLRVYVAGLPDQFNVRQEP